MLTHPWHLILPYTCDLCGFLYKEIRDISGIFPQSPQYEEFYRKKCNFMLYFTNITFHHSLVYIVQWSGLWVWRLRYRDQYPKDMKNVLYTFVATKVLYIILPFYFQQPGTIGLCNSGIDLVRYLHFLCGNKLEWK
jgi:hypothetical protein